MDWEKLRAQMVEEQLKSRDIHDARVLDAMGRVPRHLFIPEIQRKMAYENRAVPIGFDQTISQPLMVALMLQALHLTGQEKVLEIGAGSGYQAALLGHLAREVHTIEIIPELAQSAKEAINTTGPRNIHVHQGDGSLGWPKEAPYDVIVVAAACPEVPHPLVQQLTESGKLLIPLGPPSRETLTLIQKKGAELLRKELGECAFVPLRGVHGFPPAD